MPLFTWLEHPGPWLGHNDLTAKQSAETTGEHIRILVLPVMTMERSCQRMGSKRMVNHCELPIASCAVNFPIDSKTPDCKGVPATVLDRDGHF